MLGYTHSILRWFDDYNDLIAYQEEYPGDRDILPTLDIYQNFGLEGSMQIIKACQEAETTGVYDFIVITAHRAKGLEFDNVLLGDDFEPQFSDKDGLSIIALKKLIAKNLDCCMWLLLGLKRYYILIISLSLWHSSDKLTEIRAKNSLLPYNNPLAKVSRVLLIV